MHYHVGATLLNIVLLPVDGPAGLPFILADVLALGIRNYPIGFGGALVLADINLPGAHPGAHPGGFGAGKLTAGPALTDMGALVALADVDDWRSGLGICDVRNGKQAQGRGQQKQILFHGIVS